MGQLTNEIIDSVDINLPPGVITKVAQKMQLTDKVNEVVLLETINRRLAPKFREMLVLGQLGCNTAAARCYGGGSGDHS